MDCYAGLAIHPGVVKTDLVTSMSFWKRALVWVTNPMGLMTPDQGSYNTLWAATGKDFRGKLEGDVAFFEPVGKRNGGDAMCFDDNLAKELWEWTEEVVRVKA